MHLAVQARNSELVQTLLSWGVVINVLDMYGCTPLQLTKRVSPHASPGGSRVRSNANAT